MIVTEGETSMQPGERGPAAVATESGAGFGAANASASGAASGPVVLDRQVEEGRGNGPGSIEIESMDTTEALAHQVFEQQQDGVDSSPLSLSEVISDVSSSEINEEEEEEVEESEYELACGQKATKHLEEEEEKSSKKKARIEANPEWGMSVDPGAGETSSSGQGVVDSLCPLEN